MTPSAHNVAPHVLFVDLGGVVVHVESDWLIHQTAQLTGSSFDAVYEIIYHQELLLPFELGRLPALQYYEGLKRHLRLPWTYEQFVAMWNSILHENHEVTRILKRLQPRCKIVALTNTNELHLRCLQTYFSAHGIFDGWVASCEVGLRKPDPAIYHYAAKRAGVSLESVVYIDDRPELVEAGRKIGLSAIRFESSQQLEQELSRLGVEL